MDFDLVIIGAGPAGYVAALRAAQLGMKTAIVEKDNVGGMCMNWGCIPTKAMLESVKLYRRIRSAAEFGIEGIAEDQLTFNWKTAKKRADSLVEWLTESVRTLLKNQSVEIIHGEARIVNETTIKIGKRLVETPHIIIATGSLPAGQDLPVPDHLVVSIRELMSMEDIPDQLAVVGSGPTAMELAQMIRLAGKDVTLVVPDTELLRGFDPCLSEFALHQLRQDGVTVLLDSRVTDHYKGGVWAGDQRVPCRKVISAALRQGVIPASDIPLEIERGFLKVNSYLQTSVPTIYAVGDCNGRSFVAHMASAQGLNAVNSIRGIREKMNFNIYPLNIYSQPEISQVGYTEPQLKAEGVAYKVTRYEMTANAKALLEGQPGGFMRLLTDVRYGEVLGVQIAAPHATDLISEAAAVMAMEGTLFDMVRVVHAHPTISEIFSEVTFAALDQPRHPR